MGEVGRVIFSDVSQDLLDHSRSLAVENGVLGRCQFLRAPATDLSALDDASVDVVTTRSVLIYVSDKRRAFEEFFRVLKPGGRLSIFEPVTSFREPEPPELFLGCDVTPVQHLAERIKAVYERAQPRDSHPVFDFDERDLFRFAEEAGFGEVHLDYEARVAWGNPPGWGDKAWDILARAAPNPQVPSLVEAAEAALAPEDAERFLAHLKPLVEGGRRKRREARAYLWAIKVP
jgi:SAM-dependent methyltransferase